MRHTIVSNRFAGVLLITTLSLALTSVCPGQTTGRDKALFQAAKTQRPSNAKRRFPGVLRARPVSINLNTLASLRKGDTLKLSLFDDLDLRGEITYYRRTHRGTQQWAGHLPGLPGSSILLTEAEGVIAGLIRGPGLQIIKLHSAGGGRYEIIQLEAERQSGCGVGQGKNFLPQLVENPVGRFQNKFALGGASCDSGLVIDLLVVYSAEARDAAANSLDGDPAFILAEIDLAEMDVNLSYANSLINPRINVVHSALLSQGETASFSGMLSQLTNQSDGLYDEVHALRDTHGADMVAMLVDNRSLGGVAWLMGSLDPGFDAFAFSVTNWARAADSVLAHELGHNQGCCHDRNNCGVGIFSYSYGHRYNGTDSIQYRTVMSYLPGTWIKHFSSPLVNFAGLPTGEVQTDNARTINETAAVIANFRQTAVPPPASLAGVGLDRLVAPTPSMDDFFGTSVAIDGDFTVVGADFSDEGGPVDSGGAYVYRFDGISWVHQQTLTHSAPFNSDQFGNAVAIQGNVIAVGAMFDDVLGLGQNSGSVHIFRFDGTIWQPEDFLVGDDTGSFDLFGSSVAFSGDNLIVGAMLDSAPSSNSGSAYIFAYNVATISWDQVTKLVPDDGTSDDLFGVSVDIDDDVAVVGAFLDDISFLFNSGSAYVFRNVAGTWTQEAKLTAVDPKDSAFFGTSVSVSKDSTNGDIIFVGADGADGFDEFNTFGLNSGATYTFRDDTLNWVDTGKLPIPSTIMVDSGGFGYSVSVGGPIGAVGAPFGGSGSFVRYFFDGVEWLQTATVVNANNESLGISIDNDPVTNSIIIGAWTADNSQGAAYIFTGDTGLSDCNGNGLPDDCDVLEGRSLDCNTNGIPDECDIDTAGGGTSFDCNSNGIPDECDISDGTVTDCNANGIPDGCDLITGTLLDTNEDGIADICQDCDNNSLFDPDEIAADPTLDCNLNGVLDECDIADGTSADLNIDDIPDECGDCNLNGIPDFQDIIDGALDVNINNIPDECDPDCNNNGIPDDFDILVGTSFDVNDDGIPDECDPDCDNDGVSDLLQIIQGVHPDCNTNGIPDVCDIADLTSGDCNGNGIPDSCDIAEGLLDDVNMDGIDDACQDCNLNGILDPEDIATGTSRDCNLSDIPDECESGDNNENGIPDFCEDCNNNLIADHLDISSGFSLDNDGNTVPDECERDCNLNGILDQFDLADGTSRDCNLSGIPDECESGDRNGNGIPDFCEDCNNNLNPDYLDIVQEISTDINSNTIPDECDQLGDVNNDLLVNINDLLDLLANWGPCVVFPCTGDLDFNGTVDVSDLLIVLANWGA